MQQWVIDGVLGIHMNGFLVLVRYVCFDVPVQIFGEQDEFAAVNLACEIADNPCGAQDEYDAVFDALNVRLRECKQVPPFSVVVLRIAGGVVTELVDEFYAGADEDTDDDDDECDFD